MRKNNLISLILSIIIIITVFFLPNPHLIGNYQDLYFYFMYSNIFKFLFLIIGIILLLASLLYYHHEERHPLFKFRVKLHSLSNRINDKKIISVISFLFISGILILFFWSRNLISLGILTRVDFPVRYFEMYMIKNQFLPIDHSFFGYVPNFYGGFLGFPFFTPGLSIYGAIFWYFHLNPALYTRILIILALILYFSLPLKFNSVNKVPYIFYILTLFYMVNSTGWSDFITIGSLHDLYGIFLSIIFSYTFLRIVDRIRNNKTPEKYLYPIAIFSLQLLVIIQFSYLLFPGILIIYYFVSEILAIYHIKQNTQQSHEGVSSVAYKNKIKILKDSIIAIIIIVVLALIGISFWLLMVVKNINNVNLSTPLGTVLSENNYFYARYNYLEYIQNFPMFLLPFLIIGIISALKDKKNFIIRFFAASGIILFLVLTVIYLFYPLGITTFGRTIIILDFFFPALIFKGFYNTAVYLKRKRIRRYILVIIVGYITLIGTFSTANRAYHNDNFTQVNPNATQIYQWLQNNTNDQSRTMLEDTIFSQEQVWGSGRLISLAPIYSDSMLIGGYYPNYYLKQSSSANFFAGSAFGENISTISISNFTQDLNKFNIHYIIAWYPDTLNYLNSHSNLFKKVTVIGNFTIFDYINYSGSYSLNGEFKPINSVLYNLSTDYVKLLVRNVTEAEKIVLSFSSCPELEVKVNSTIISTTTDDNLISFNSPNNGDIMVEIEYQKSTLSSLLTDVFILSNIVWPLAIIIFVVKEKNIISTIKKHINKLKSK